MSKRLILVGGFLAAGKTTLLWKSVAALTAQGEKVGLITNDQAPDLADTTFLKQTGVSVEEVAGSCFCCNFNGFTEAMQHLFEQGATVIVGEPVGSCTDLSATILQPVKKLFGDTVKVEPFSVLIEPARLNELLGETPPMLADSARYILDRQLAEADIILLSKADTLFSHECENLLGELCARYPQADVLPIQARNGGGLDAWFSTLDNGRGAGRTIAEVDYDTYADGEAVLGWLNAEVQLSSDTPRDWLPVAQQWLGDLQQSLAAKNLPLGHLKFALTLPDGTCTKLSALVEGGKPVQQADGVTAASGTKALLTINARVQTTPETLQQAVEACLANHPEASIVRLRCLQPGRPNPTHRYAEVV